MCPPLSCCYGRSTGHLPTLLYYLGRLLLARPEDLSPGQRRRLPARRRKLWRHYRADLRARFAGRWPYAPALADQLVASLLARACCRQTLCQHVSLSEALLVPRHWHWRRGQRAARHQHASVARRVHLPTPLPPTPA